MVQASMRERVLDGCHKQWVIDYVERMKSERLLCAMLLASTCLLYGNRWLTTRREFTTTKGGPLLKGDPLLQ